MRVTILITHKIAVTVQAQNRYELEIWGKAQRESARRPKSDWGKLRGGRVKKL